MACVNPLLRPVDENKTIFAYVPCGWCIACRQDKLRQWSSRAEYEFLIQNRKGAFVTYTYKDDCLPQNGSVDKKHPKLVADRLRSRLKIKFKYLISAEYGDNVIHYSTKLPLGRPHMHCLFFGIDYKKHYDTLKDVWKDFAEINSIRVLPITQGSTEYVLKYCLKEVHGQQLKEIYENYGLIPPFAHFSKGLGANYYYDNLDFIKENNNCTLYHGKLLPVPPYWLKKLGLHNSLVNLSPQYFEMSFARYFNSLTKVEKIKLLDKGFYSLKENNYTLYQRLKNESDAQLKLDMETNKRLNDLKKL